MGEEAADRTGVSGAAVTDAPEPASTTALIETTVEACRWETIADIDGPRFKHDLRPAGIDPEDTGEGVLDFHALRHTYITRLMRAGVAPKVMQTLARHSTIELTLGRYSHLSLSDPAAAIDSLPDLTIRPNLKTGS